MADEKVFHESDPENEKNQVVDSEPFAEDLSDDDLAEVPGGANNICGFGCSET